MSEATPSSQPQNFVHLFLRDAPRFFVSYMNTLEKRYPAVKTELEEIKQRAVNQLKKIYTHEQLEHWRKTGLERKQAFVEWSSEQESKRQMQTIALLKNSIYDALVVIEMEIAVERDLSYEEVDALNSAVKGLHGSVILEINERKFEEYNQKGHFEIHSHAIVPTHSPAGDMLDLSFKLEQYGVPYSPIYEPSKNPATFSPINALIDALTVKTPNGQTLTWKKLRSGFFDCHLAQKEHHLVRFSDQELAKDRQHLNSLSKQKLRDHVDALLKQQDPVALQRFVDILNWDVNRFGPPSAALEHYIKKDTKHKEELENLLNEKKVILPLDKECIKQYITNANTVATGFSIPIPVLELSRQDENFKGHGWAMVSLLHAFNFFTAHTLNKGIESKLKRAGIFYASRTVLDKWRRKYVNSLDSLYREMTAFKEVSAEQNIAPSLFFNFPIKSPGQEFLQVGPQKIFYNIGPQLVYSAHDKPRAQAVKEETQHNYQSVISLANQAIQLLDREEQRTQDPVTKNVFKKYKTTLKCLMEQSVKIDSTTKLPTLKISQPVDSLARFCLLLQMLNINVNVHDIYGTDFPMIWTAKCNQLLACLAVSKDGTIPDIDVTSMTLKPSTYDSKTGRFNAHWSFDVFLKTIVLNVELQKARNDFVSAIFFDVLANATLGRALTLGAFELMRFQQDELDNARLRVQD